MLNKKQKQFCKEYVKTFNGAQSAVKAGYSKKNAKVIASRLMTNPEITSEMVELQNKLAKKHELTHDAIILSIRDIRTKCLNAMDGFEVIPETKDSKSIRIESKNGPAYAIAALKANELMGRHIGMWPQKIELDVNAKAQDEKQSENQKRVLGIISNFAILKSGSNKKTRRMAGGSKT